MQFTPIYKKENATIYQGGLFEFGTSSPKGFVNICAAELSDILPDLNKMGVNGFFFPLDDYEMFDKDALALKTKLTPYVDKLFQLFEDGESITSVCQMGYNRSGLLNGLLLRRIGFTGPEAVAMIKRARPRALSNQSFIKLILS